MHPGFVDAAGMLPVPKIHTRREDQREGRACVWCGHRQATLAPLGPRLSADHGLLTRWTPQACSVCIHLHANRVLQIHVGICQECTRMTYCPDARALHALASTAHGMREAR
ncbi:hypothetical protein QFZ75_003704 [Streptomyces sp. V3I8]|nr:hypothetical protein [Streptomyces sp. V3I8]